MTALNDTMNIVNFKVYNGEKLNKALENITESDGVVNLTFIDNFDEHLLLDISPTTIAIKPGDDAIYSRI